jgi:glycosyltransferase involved in cell wall biosynthesis
MTYKSSPFRQEFEEAGIQLIDFHPEKKFNKSEIQKIRDVLIKENIHIVHLFNSKAIINGIKASRDLPVKVVLYRGFTGNIHWYDPSAYIKYLHPRVDKIFCNSKGVEKHLQKQFFFNKKKTITIYKGHDVYWYNKYHELLIKEELEIPENSFLLVNVSNNRKMKGIPYLLKAMNLLPDDLPIHLLLVGDNMDDRINLAIINSGNKQSKIHILGFRSDALNLVKSCDVLVFPSISGEGMPKAVIEAMALEIPPIVTDIPGNNELVVNGKSGIIVPPKDPESFCQAIMKLYQNRAKCKELGKYAHLRIKNHFSLEQSIQQTKELYEELVSN